MDFVIRECRVDDVQGVKTCIQELKNWEAQFDPDYLTSQESVDKLFDHIWEHDKLFVAEADNKIVGFIAFGEQSKNEDLISRPVKTIYISDLVVLPEFRKMGLGEKLIKVAENYARKLGIEYLKLITFSKNYPARSLYSKVGFEDYESTMLKRLE